MVSEENDVLPQGKMATISEPYTEKELELFQKQTGMTCCMMIAIMHGFKRCTQIWQLSPNPQKQLTIPLKARFVYRTHEQEAKPPTTAALPYLKVPR